MVDLNDSKELTTVYIVLSSVSIVYSFLHIFLNCVCVTNSSD